MDIRLSADPPKLSYKDNGIVVIEESLDLEFVRTLIRDECLNIFAAGEDFVYRLFNLAEAVKLAIARDNGKLAFEAIIQAFSEQVESSFRKTLEIITSQSSFGDLPLVLNNTWHNFFMPMNCIVQKLIYLDLWLGSQSRKRTLSESIIRLFREARRPYYEIYPKIEEMVLKELEICRRNYNHNVERVIYLIKFLEFSGGFDEFKERLSRNIVEYYSNFGNIWVRDMDFREYVTLVHKIYLNEHKLLINFLDKQEVATLLDRVVIVLIDENYKHLLTQNNIGQILAERDYKLLRLVKTLFSRGCESYYIKILVQSLVKFGLQVILDNKHLDHELVIRLMQFNSFIKELKRFAFGCDYQFEDKSKVWKTVLENINALRYVLCGLSLFFDYVLQNPKNFSSEAFIFAINLCKYIKCKDDFEKLIRHVISKRLVYIHNLNGNYKILVNRLKSEFGPSFTHQITILLEDFNISREINGDFQKSNGGFSNFETLIVSNLVWFKNKVCETLQLTFDQTVENVNNLSNNEYEEIFTNFYQNKFKNRKLRYIPEYYVIHLSGIFTGKYGKRREVTFQLSLVQATLFLMFNRKNIVTFDELKREIAAKWSFNLTDDLDLLIKGHIEDLLAIEPSLIQNTKNGYMLNKDYSTEVNFVKIYNPNEIRVDFTLNIITDNVTLVDRDTACRIDFMLVKFIKGNSSSSFENICKFIHDNMDIDISVELIKRQLDGLVDRKFVSSGPSNSYSYIP